MSVDDKIVSMKFDNGAFEQKLGDTLKSLDKLQQSLNNTGSVNGFKDLDAAAKGFDLSHMGAGIDGISAKFAALATIGITALANITNRAVDAGIQLAKSLTIAPIMDGFREYETNMNSIQTILSNTDAKGTTLQEVNAALDQLNHYSDQTIYNFSEMARNIGTFTAAGVDLDTSVSSIKGIANLAAISGSNSQQASTAMYQLSQAIATGSVKLMDWNSVVNAGMGGEVFQRALFESGKAMGTLNDVPMSQTFDQWTDAGNSFRESLQDGWITGEVLTNTLQGFTGDLSEAQIMSMGYTEAQAQEMMRLGALGKAAATEVKTLTQLMGTIKESVASGWSSSFRLIFGDFEEAKVLFTGINNAIGEIVGNSADARNEVLQGWKDMGGRDLLIKGLGDAVKGLGTILKPVADAFRDIFPRKTAEDLMGMTRAFADFASKISISGETASNIKSVFSGLFSILKIGWEVIKGVASVIGDLLGSLGGAGGGILDFAANIGDTVTGFQEMLVQGGLIRDFFDRVGEVIQNPIRFLENFREILGDLFTNFSGAELVASVMERVGERFSMLSGVARNVADAFSWVAQKLEGVRNVLETVWGHLSTWFGELKDKISNIFNPSDFNGAVDAVNVGLLGGIIVLLRKFMNNGLDLNFGGDLIEKMSEAFGGLTDTLGVLQANLKAGILMKIAIAVGVLAASIVVLSLIDSAALAKSLTAIGVGFGVLIGVMTALDKISLGTGAAKLSGLAVAMGLLAGAVLILSAAIKNLSSLSLAELAKGLGGVAVGLGILVVAVNAISTNTAGLVRAGIAMMVISVGLRILAEAVEAFAEISWGDMARGMVGVGVGLGIIVTAMNFMPPGMAAAGAGLVLIATGLRILAEAVMAFATMSWGEMAKGFAGVAGGLVAIAGAMWLMPPHMVAQAAAILILSAALNVMAQAVQAMGSMDFGSLAKGIGGFAAMLLILAVGLTAMTGTAAGAGALIVAAGALVILTGVLKTLGDMSLTELAMGLGAIAAVMAVLGLSGLLLAPVVPMLTALGWSLMLIGGAFALFGVGAMLVAKAFETLASAGRHGVRVLISVITELIKALPQFVSAFVASLAEMAAEIITAIPIILGAFRALMSQLLDTVIELVPKFAEAFVTIVTAILTTIIELYPLLMEAGMTMLLTFLQGILNGMPQIATLGLEIILAFVTTLATNMNSILDAGINLMLTFLLGIAGRMQLIVAAGVALVVSFINGLSASLYQITTAATNLIVTFITGIGNNASKIVTAGTETIVKFINGISNNLGKIITAGADLIIKFIEGIQQNANRIIEAAADAVIDFMNGVANTIRTRSGEFKAAGRNIADAIVDGLIGGLGDSVRRVTNKAVDLARSALDAVGGFLGINSPSRKFIEIGRFMGQGMAVGLARDTTAENSGVALAQRVTSGIQTALDAARLSLEVMDEFNPTITPVLDLTKVQVQAGRLEGMMAKATLVPEVSFDQARLISTIPDREVEMQTPVTPQPTEIRFEQNIFAPQALSTNDIYRSTKSQIALAKEELDIS